MKSILDSSFKYTPAAATDIRNTLSAHGATFKFTAPIDELERLRRFRRQIEAAAIFSNDEAVFIQSEFEQMLAQADGFAND